jgi:hypothetical protein
VFASPSNRAERRVEMMADLVKEHASNHNVTRDLNPDEWPRQLLDDLVHHDFDPSRFSLPRPVISTECHAPAILARSSIAFPVGRDGRFREKDRRQAQTVSVRQRRNETLYGRTEPVRLFFTFDLRNDRCH